MKNRSLTKHLPVLLLAAVAAAPLAGCTATDDSATAQSIPSSSATSTTSAEPPTGTCVDGEAVVVVDLEHPDAQLDGDCPTVSIVGSDGTATLGNVDHLVVEGTGLRITVGTVGTIDYAGDGNTVSHTGPAPEVHADGTTENVTEVR